MLEEFSFGNFWSFKDIQTLNMSAAKIKSKKTLLDTNNIFAANKTVNLVKSKAIYGANGGGKSNVVRALAAFVSIVADSVKEEKALSLIDAFQLSTETVAQPTFFQLIFRVGNMRCRYGFEADDKSIKSEWLFATPNKREQPLFIREKNKIIEMNQTHFEEGILYQKLFENSKDQVFTDTSLFLTHLNSIGFAKFSKLVFQTISSIIIVSGVAHKGLYSVAGEALGDAIEKKFILELLNKADVGIDDLKIVGFTNDNLPNGADEELKQELKNDKIIVSSRTKFDSRLKAVGESEFLFGSQESEGVRKMFELSPFIYRSLKNGVPLVIDEFDSRFHPLLTKRIVELYNSPENESAQLIYATLNTNLLSADLLRRDQIDFVEKDKYGASHLYSLVELKGVRNDAAFEKDYIQGKYGAIPILGDFTHLIS